MKRALLVMLAVSFALTVACDGGKNPKQDFSSLAALNVKTIAIIIDASANRITAVPDSVMIANNRERIQWVILNTGAQGVTDVVIDHFERTAPSGHASDHDPFGGSRFSSGAINPGDLSDSQMSNKAVAEARGGNFKYNVTVTRADGTKMPVLDPVLIVD
jgi:hypothetical protein